MAIIPEPTDSTVKRIFAAWEKKETPRFSRRLGASQIGRPCDREIWYSFRWAKQQCWEGRMLRLFAKGHLEEACVERDLKMIGAQFLPVDPDTGEQFEFSELGDHFVCKLDGAVCGLVEAPATWHVVEIKTANQKAFDAVVKDGCKKAKPEHYAQMQTGMAMSGMDRAAYIVVCKNTDDIYFERIDFDPKEWKRILQRAKEVIFATDAPDRLNDSPAWWQCKFCGFAGVCHGDELAEKNCRTCVHSVALEDGGWACDRHDKVIGADIQPIGCSDHAWRGGMAGATADKVAASFGGRLTADPDSLSV